MNLYEDGFDTRSVDQLYLKSYLLEFSAALLRLFSTSAGRENVRSRGGATSDTGSQSEPDLLQHTVTCCHIGTIMPYLLYQLTVGLNNAQG